MRNLRDQDSNRVIQLDSVARGLRNLGKKYKLYNFSLTQAGDSASNKLYLATLVTPEYRERLIV